MSEKIPMEKALQSSDPIVRNAAIRRMAIDQEKIELDAFLSYYLRTQVDGEVADSPKLPQVGEVKTKPRAAPAREGKEPRVGKGSRLAEAVKTVLVGHGQPMQLQALFDALRVAGVDTCPPKVDSLRPRLHEQRDKIQMIRGLGYWPAGMEVPA